ncbi:MAG: SWIM zinc finger family protein [Cytophagaceae bacterium]|jgi:hypothetical protein|nr:SWIM zinc finger family protein [Cytophagaceae bacterium]
MITEDHVRQLAPDAASAKAGTALAVLSKWKGLAKHTEAIWGYCQGSGKDPYFTRVDVQQWAFQCTCPSRKFPCKHGIALILLWVRQPNQFSSQEMPSVVSEWIQKRRQKEQAPAEKNPTEKSKNTSDASTKRSEARERSVRDGILELRQWIADLMRTGMMHLPSQAGSFHENMAARLVDAKAPGLAAMMRQVGEVNVFEDRWPLQLSKHLSKIYLITESFLKEDQQSPLFRQEVRQLIGWNTSKEDVLTGEAHRDEWLVMARRMEEQQEMNAEYIWLYGRNKARMALVLNFYFGAQRPLHSLVPGMAINAELCYYSSLMPLRALIKEPYTPTSFFSPAGLSDLEDAAGQIAQQMAVFPFTNRIPLLLKEVQLIRIQKKWHVRDAGNRILPLCNDPEECWKVLAWSGGASMNALVLFIQGQWRLESVWNTSEIISCWT